MRLFWVAAGFSVLIAPVGAEVYPYRAPSYLRQVFMENVTRKCISNNEDAPEARMRPICECVATQVATFITQRDLDEIAAGGAHVTPRYTQLADQAERGCFKAFTGKELD